MRRVLFVLFFLTFFVEADVNRTSIQKRIAAVLNPDSNQTAPKKVKLTKKQILLNQKQQLELELRENNIWSKIYSNYHTYQVLKDEEKILDDTIQKLSKKKRLKNKDKETLEILKGEKAILVNKLQLLQEYEENPFKKFLAPPPIANVPSVQNPFAVISAFSYLEKLKSDKNEYNTRYESILDAMKKFKETEVVLGKLAKLEPENEALKKELSETQEQIKTFVSLIDIFKTTQSVYTKKVDEIELKLSNDVKKEVQKAINIGLIILFFLVILLLVKYLVRRYMSDNERFYLINKILNITFFTLLILTLLFAYIENVSYLVTILGFASAGIAIAMKDWFMSLMGWLVIVLGGAIHVGDRIRVVRDGVEYVGDIVDISLLRMTMHEDITLTTYMVNRRAGRIVFIPNNFIFTDLIANYAHAGLKTVWDGIDFTVTFDSDVHKATVIAKEVAKKYSKGYTDITRKQLNKLRSQYSMKNTNVEPRIFSLIEPYGMKISVWYLTNSFATLTLRSTISLEIVSRIQQEENVHLAFPTQSIYVDKDVRKPPFDPETTVVPNKKELS